MKNKNIIIGLVVAVVVIGIILVARPFISKKPAKKVVATKVEKKQPAAPAKKAISKDKGGLTVRIVDSKKREMGLRIRAFKSIDAKSSIYQAAFVANRMQELSPGTYDIEIETVPQTIYKNVKVAKGRETLIDLGCVVGVLTIKALDENKKEVRCSVRVVKAENNEPVVTATANRPIEILRGVYNVEIASTPRQEKKEIKVNAGEETTIEFLVQAPPAPPARATPTKAKK